MNFDVSIKPFDHDKNSLLLLGRKDYVKYSFIQTSLVSNIHYSPPQRAAHLLEFFKDWHFVPTDALLSIYRSLILPYRHNFMVLLYAWGQAAQKKLGKLHILQESSLRLIHFSPYRSHAIPFFNQYNILQLNFQFCKSVCTIIHDVSNNSLPANSSNLFLYPTQVHSYNTRFSATGSFNIKYSRTNQLKHSFSILGARIWNSIPQSIRILPKHKFKLSLHQLYFLCILELEDTCVDTPIL